MSADTFHECINNGFDLLREQIALRDQEETADTLQWLEKEVRSICRQFDECWERMEAAEEKLQQRNLTLNKGVLICQNKNPR